MPDREDINAVFVYGTLKRGQCREHAWPCLASDIRDAVVFGELWGRSDYPALTRGRRRVVGELRRFKPSQISRVLEVLDEIEGTDGNLPHDLYHRHIIDATLLSTHESLRAYAYFYARCPERDGFRLIHNKRDHAGLDYQSWPQN